MFRGGDNGEDTATPNTKKLKINPARVITMQNESIIKLIGRRPVYRVERNRIFGPSSLEANAWERDRTPVGASQEEQTRPVMGSEDLNPAHSSL
jgi:hypothetical protein